MPNTDKPLHHPRLALLLLAALGAASSLQAATFTSFSSACGIGGTVTNSTYAATQGSDPTCHGGVEVEGFAGPAGIGSYAEMYADAASGAGGGDQYGTILFFTTFRNAGGTPGFTDVALNLTQSNTFADPYTGFGQGPNVGITIETFLYSPQTSTFSRGNGATSAVGITQVQLGATNQLLTTSLVNLPLNTVIGVWFRLRTDIHGAGGTEYLLIDALNTLTLSTSGPVFQLQDGISVDDVPELYLFNNRFTPPNEGAVPEPATVALMGLGLAALALRRQRRP